MGIILREKVQKIRRKIVANAYTDIFTCAAYLVNVALTS